MDLVILGYWVIGAVLLVLGPLVIAALWVNFVGWPRGFAEFIKSGPGDRLFSAAGKVVLAALWAGVLLSLYVFIRL